MEKKDIKTPTEKVSRKKATRKKTTNTKEEKPVAKQSTPEPNLEANQALKTPAETLNLLDYFDAVFCINLDARPERWELFEKRIQDAKLSGYERYSGIDGKICPAPAWWKSGDGAWGCMMSHLRICQDALAKKLNNYLVFEDDVVFCENFIPRFKKTMRDVSSLKNKWDLLYLGGQHLYVESARPYPYKENLVKCYNINRTHAFAVNGPIMKKFSQHVIHAPDYINWKGDPKWPPHIDHQLGILHPQVVTIAAKDWLCGQSAGVSNVSNKQLPEHWWHDKGWNS